MTWKASFISDVPKYLACCDQIYKSLMSTTGVRDSVDKSMELKMQLIKALRSFFGLDDLIYKSGNNELMGE